MISFDFNALRQTDELHRLDAAFLSHLNAQDASLHQQLLDYRQLGLNSPLEASKLIISLGPMLDAFIAQLFGIVDEVAALSHTIKSDDPIFVFKSWFVLRQARRQTKNMDAFPAFKELDKWLEGELNVNCAPNDDSVKQRDEKTARHPGKRQRRLSGIQILKYLDSHFRGNDKAAEHSESAPAEVDKELAVARLAQHYLADQDKHSEAIEKLTQWCAYCLVDKKASESVKDWVSFRLPNKIDHDELVSMFPVPDDTLERKEGPKDTFRQRDGFHLTDERMSRREALNEIDYCVYCHEKEGDFCSKGFPVKKSQPELGLKINPLDEVMTGCPLEEKISEMHVLKRGGYSIAALATIMIDNPMCPATGHRICNDCMKGCIYQKQQPVDIPQVETRVLTDVLSLPWGVEIYNLFTRWNPLSDTQWCEKAYNGKKVLVMGMGPAGFTMAHHLLMEGCAVLGVDGLKIEPLPNEYVNAPIKSFQSICEDLNERVMAGFGGVAEYGITVRWDKNFLKLIYITLSRRKHFQVYGSVRFGGTLTVEDAWGLGFDHMCIAVGAGLPKELPIPGSLAPGMRQANDFLMALQLTGAAKDNTLANLQVSLPAVVIGGGLTGIDTATEVQAYYIKQVEKTLARYETLSEILGEARIQSHFKEREWGKLREFLKHGREVKKERELAQKENRAPDFIRLIRSWGGVTVVYRRRIQASPAYRRNHEEVNKALEEGIYYAEGLEPVAARLDRYGEVEGIVCRARVLDEHKNWVLSDDEKTIPARSILIATGARPNVAYEFEHQGTFERKKFKYLTFEDSDSALKEVEGEGHAKSKKFGAFTSYDKNDKRVTFIGDTHPTFHGSVVKAIASAKRTYPKVMDVLKDKRADNYNDFSDKIKTQFDSKVVSISRHSPSVVELTVYAPIATRNFKPGQFYRIQNYETQSNKVNGTLLQTEALAMVGAQVDKMAGTIKMLVIETGASSRLVATLKPGQTIAVMGPTGVRTRIDHNNDLVMIIGGRQAIANVMALGPAMKKAGNRVLFIACLTSRDEVHCQKELEEATDSIVWLTKKGQSVTSTRQEDVSATCDDFAEGLLQYAKGDVTQTPHFTLEEVDRGIVIGSAELIKSMQAARHTVLKTYLKKSPPFSASIYGPMQCMLKGVCAQCLQWQIDPETGERTKAVFTCSWQDQPMDIVDYANLQDRLSQNAVQEKLTNLWLDYLFNHFEIEKI